MNKVTKILLDIVQIDSPSGQESMMIEFIKNWLKESGYEYKVDKLGNIFAYNDGSGDPILLCAHMDTVQPGIGIKPKLQDGNIKSDGNTILGADNKATIAAIITAIEKYENSVVREEKKAIELLFTVKEETGGGVEFFPFEWIKSKKGYVFDSSNQLGGIVLASPYIYNFEVEYVGKSTHTSTPEKGKNSLLPAIQFLNQLKLGQVSATATINVGQVTSGKGINIIPENTKLKGEVRSYDENEFNSLLANIESNAKKFGKKFEIKCNFKESGYCSGYVYDGASSIVQEVKNVLQCLKLEPYLIHKSGISDANPLIEAGIEVINLADGVKNPHTKEESITEEDLELLSKIVYNLIVSRL